MLNLSSETENAIRIAISVCVYLGLFIAVSCRSPEFELKSNAQIINTPEVKADSLEQTAKKLTGLHDSKSCKEFIDAFPNTFQDFNQLYGYDDAEGARKLFSKCEEHISYFFNCSEVSDLEKLNKVIKVGIDGKWDADAIGMFADLSFGLLKVHPNETKEILDKLPDEKASSFWFFMFDGPHPNDKQNVEKVNVIIGLLGKESKQARLLSVQIQKLRTSEH